MRTKLKLYAVALVLLLAQVAMAHTVSWDAGSPSSAAGEISVKGSFVPDPGWDGVALSIVATPTGGGTPLVGGGTAGSNAWSGKLTGVPKGQYTIICTVTFAKPKEKNQPVAAPVSQISVP